MDSQWRIIAACIMLSSDWSMTTSSRAPKRSAASFLGSARTTASISPAPFFVTAAGHLRPGANIKLQAADKAKVRHRDSLFSFSMQCNWVFKKEQSYN